MPAANAVQACRAATRPRRRASGASVRPGESPAESAKDALLGVLHDAELDELVGMTPTFHRELEMMLCAMARLPASFVG